MVQVVSFGHVDGVMLAYSDPGWAECLKTRKSTRRQLVYRELADRTLASNSKCYRFVVGGSRAVRCH